MSDAGQDPVRCRATRRDGRPCTAPAVRDGLCIGHQPDAASAQVKGGAASSSANRSAKLLPSRLQPMVRLLETVFAELYQGKRSARDAVALASVALAIGRLFMIGEHEQRLRDIEASIAETQRQARQDRSRWGGAGGSTSA